MFRSPHQPIWDLTCKFCKFGCLVTYLIKQNGGFNKGFGVEMKQNGGDKRDNNCFGEECLKNQQEHMTEQRTSPPWDVWWSHTHMG